MKHLLIISAGFLSAVVALPATAESSKDAALVRACMPQFSAQNTLSIPEECSYKIGNNLGLPEPALINTLEGLEEDIEEEEEDLDAEDGGL